MLRDQRRAPTFLMAKEARSRFNTQTNPRQKTGGFIWPNRVQRANLQNPNKPPVTKLGGLFCLDNTTRSRCGQATLRGFFFNGEFCDNSVSPCRGTR